KHLARVELGCEPMPCRLLVDGVNVEPGPRYLLPGARALGAAADDGGQAEQRSNLEAGSSYRIVLYLVKPGAAPRAAQVARVERPTGASGPNGSPKADRPATSGLPPG